MSITDKVDAVLAALWDQEYMTGYGWVNFTTDPEGVRDALVAAMTTVMNEALEAKGDSPSLVKAFQAGSDFGACGNSAYCQNGRESDADILEAAVEYAIKNAV